MTNTGKGRVMQLKKLEHLSVKRFKFYPKKIKMLFNHKGSLQKDVLERKIILALGARKN